MEEYRNKKKYYPILVSTKLGVLDLPEDVVKIQNKFLTLPKKTHDLLVSDEIVDFIYAVEQRYRLSDAQTEEFSRMVRQYFFREITDGGFAQKTSGLCRTSPDDALALLRAINAIVPKQEQEEQAQQVRTAQMSLADALVKYPRIKDQNITSRAIVSKPFLQPLQPTIKNWIMVYEKILGVSRHDAIERGEFVFRAEATRALSGDERNLLAEILRSRDENTPITVDVDTQKIIATAQEKSAPVQQRVMQQRPRNVFVPQKTVQAPPRPMIQRQENKNIQAPHRPFNEKVEGKQIVGKVADPRKNPVFESLQQEIIKNRIEMQGGITEQVQNSAQQGATQGNAQRTIGSPVVPPTNLPTATTQEKTPVSGTIQFSSNHIMPAEKSNKNTLQATKNYFNMAPIGGTHTLTQKGKE
ncbi:MAG: hypothetical protein WC819_06710 [Parcubacteria group bacterium]|jgi:hypothetical protein